MIYQRVGPAGWIDKFIGTALGGVPNGEPPPDTLLKDWLNDAHRRRESLNNKSVGGSVVAVAQV